MPLVRRALLRRGGRSRLDADDLAQITCERILRAIMNGKLRADCNLATWAITIANHVAIDHHRACERERGLFGDNPVPADQTCAEILDEELYHWQSAVDDLLCVLERMRPLDAKALLLRHGNGCSIAEIANHLGASESAAASRLVRAQRELRRRAAGLRSRVLAEATSSPGPS